MRSLLCVALLTVAPIGATTITHSESFAMTIPNFATSSAAYPFYCAPSSSLCNPSSSVTLIYAIDLDPGFFTVTESADHETYSFPFTPFAFTVSATPGGTPVAQVGYTTDAFDQDGFPTYENDPIVEGEVPSSASGTGLYLNVYDPQGQSQTMDFNGWINTANPVELPASLPLDPPDPPADPAPEPVSAALATLGLCALWLGYRRKRARADY